MPTIIMSVNDLESAMIRLLAQGRPAVEVVDLQTPWGRHDVSDVAELLREQRSRPDNAVILIEAPAIHLAPRLRAMGKDVAVIDHHLYQRPGRDTLDLANSLSSLEQFCLHMKIDISEPPADDLPPCLSLKAPGGVDLGLDDIARLVSANDRGHIPLLAREAVGICGLREDDYEGPEIQGPEELWDAKLEELSDEGRDDAGAGGERRDGRSAFKDMEALVWDLRLKEMALAQGIAAGKNFADLSGAKAFEEERSRLESLFYKAGNYLCAAFKEGNARRLCTGRTDASDPELWLVRAPISFRKVLYDALYWWRAQQGHPLTQRLGALLLFHADGDPERLRGLEFYGRDDERPAAAQWFDPALRDEWGTQRLDFWAGGGEGCFFGADDLLGSESAALSRLADGILNGMLTGNRPLAAWRTNFMQALRFKCPRQEAALLANLRREAQGGKQGDLEYASASEAERPYFMNHLQEPLGLGDEPGAGCQDGAGRRLCSLERRVEEGLALHLTLPNHARPYTLPIRSLRLHFFYNQVVILEWVMGDEQKTDDYSFPFWAQLLGSAAEGVLCLAQVLDINAKARFCYSTYDTQYRGGQAMIRLVRESKVLGCLKHGGQVDPDGIGGWFKELLATALGRTDSGLPCLKLLGDDRARVFSSAVPLGSYPDSPWGRERFEEILARFNTVDGYGQGHFYYQPFARKELADGLYERFRSDGSLFACTSHSMVFLGFGGFSLHPIHSLHMAGMYRRMFLLVMFYQAILQGFALDMEGMHSSSEDAAVEGGYRRLRERLLLFTNYLWFRRVSSQVQGVELFDLLTKQFGLDADYGLIAQKIERAEELYTSRARQRSEDFQWILAPTALWAALLVGLLAISPLTWLKEIWTALNNWSSICAFPALAVVSFIPVGLAWVVKKWRQRKAKP